MEISYSGDWPYGEPDQVLAVDGTGHIYHQTIDYGQEISYCQVTQPHLEIEEPSEKEQSYYKRVCEFYKRLDPQKYNRVKEDMRGYRYMSYKMLYKSLKTEFRNAKSH